MRYLVLAITIIMAITTISRTARADMVGAAAGAGSGLVVAGPVGAVAGGVVGGVFGRPGHIGDRQLAIAGSITVSVAIARIIGITDE
jgi:hypothetical protein